MLTINIPTWSLFAVGGLLAGGLILLMLRIWMHKHLNKISAETQRLAVTTDFSSRIQNQMLTQHIDTVFNTIVAKIESEHSKLKALIENGVDAELPSASLLAQFDKTTQQQAKPIENLSQKRIHGDIGSTIAEYLAKGMKPDDITKQLSVSRDEVDLVIKLRKGLMGKTQHRLKAVV